MPLYVLPAKKKEIKNYILLALAKIIGGMCKMMRGEIAQNYNTRTSHSLLLCTKMYYTFFNVLRHVIIII